MEKSEDLDELWEMTEGTLVCPECGSYHLFGHIRECSLNIATVDWVCEDCGHKWCTSCPFEDGCLTVDASEV